MRPALGLRHVRALRDKYERILELRELHSRARADPSFVEPDPKRAMTRLSARYPGALRELDTLALATIRGRIAELTRVEHALERDAEPRSPRWAIAQARFHDLARAILIAKRWTRAKDRPLPAAARAWKDDLARVAKPPRGRLMDLVFARVAEDLGIAVGEARALIFTPRAR